MSAIEAKGLTKFYGDTIAVNEIDMNVEKGEIFGLIGPNGSGKTTTVKMLSTLLPPTRGSARVLGYTLGREDRKIRERIGVVQQVESYEAGLTVYQNLDVYGLLWNIPRRDRRARIEELLQTFDLANYQNKKIAELSVGTRRRLQVAREFLHEFELLFLDEPTVGLDPLSKRSLLNMIKKSKEKGTTIFLTTNMLDEADYLCDRIAILSSGRLAITATPEQLKKIYGGFKTIELQISSGDLTNLVEAIKRLESPLISTDEGGVIRIYSKDPFKLVSSIIELANKLSISVESISIKEPSLEEAFINFVESYRES